ncbi:MAG: response regulator transcription factor [Proteobacteria bacterium]|nr:response regulator transcription factor [Pseudomonadota bacterium]
MRKTKLKKQHQLSIHTQYWVDTKLKLPDDIQWLRAHQERQEGVDSTSSDRRIHDRRRQRDRRDSLILRGHARYERRRNDRREPVNLHERLLYLRAGTASTRLTPVSIFSLPTRDSLRIGVVSEQTDLSNILYSYSNRLPHIHIDLLSDKEISGIGNKLEDTRLDVILIDMRLPLDRVIEQLRIVRKWIPSIKIILLYEQNLPDLINEIIEYRISGFLQIGIDYRVFEKALHVVVHRGELWFPHRLICKIFDTLSSWQNPSCAFPQRDIVLTKSEQEIIKLVTKGLTNKQIAQQLTVSPETVKKHLKSVFIKTGVRNRSQLVFGYFSGISDFK